jgi:hypothetical protein
VDLYLGGWARVKVGFIIVFRKLPSLTPSIGRVAKQTSELDFWDEMNRREKWDRAFERKIRTTSMRSSGADEQSVKEGLELERQHEDKRRLEWDAQQVKKLVT